MRGEYWLLFDDPVSLMTHLDTAFRTIEASGALPPLVIWASRTKTHYRSYIGARLSYSIHQWSMRKIMTCPHALDRACKHSSGASHLSQGLERGCDECTPSGQVCKSSHTRRAAYRKALYRASVSKWSIGGCQVVKRKPTNHSAV